MIPDWMADQLNKEAQVQSEERPRLEIPVPPQDWRPYPEEHKEEERSDRGVTQWEG